MKIASLSRSLARRALVFTACLLGVSAYALVRYEQRLHAFTLIVHGPTAERPPVIDPHYSPFQKSVLNELAREVGAGIVYQDGYYDGGEPPPKIGVCSDVVIRSFRAAGIDLQKLVQDDIRSRRGAYKVEKPDPNIDHRRCRNLLVYFRTNAKILPASGADANWQPGDVVFWDTYGDGRVDHVGMVFSGKDSRGYPTIVHHWPGLPVSETDGLHRFRIMGHFRWIEKKRNGEEANS